MDHQQRERVAKLADEMLHRGVPRELVQPIANWLDTQNAPGAGSYVWRSHVYTCQPDHEGEFQVRCVHCGLRYKLDDMGSSCQGTNYPGWPEGSR